MERVGRFFIEFQDVLVEFLKNVFPLANSRSNLKQTDTIKKYLHIAGGNLGIRTLLFIHFVTETHSDKNKSIKIFHPNNLVRLPSLNGL